MEQDGREKRGSIPMADIKNWVSIIVLNVTITKIQLERNGHSIRWARVTSFFSSLRFARNRNRRACQFTDAVPNQIRLRWKGATQKSTKWNWFCWTEMGESGKEELLRCAQFPRVGVDIRRSPFPIHPCRMWIACHSSHTFYFQHRPRWIHKESLRIFIVCFQRRTFEMRDKSHKLNANVHFLLFFSHSKNSVSTPERLVFHLCVCIRIASFFFRQFICVIVIIIIFVEQPGICKARNHHIERRHIKKSCGFKKWVKCITIAATTVVGLVVILHDLLCRCHFAYSPKTILLVRRLLDSVFNCWGASVCVCVCADCVESYFDDLLGCVTAI